MLQTRWRETCRPLLSRYQRHFSFSSVRWAAKLFDLEEFMPTDIRNFSIIAHIDHGKSTLADRLLEMTGTIDKKATGMNKQVLDKLKVERERGITVKAQTASMIHTHNGRKHLLNLIDTPGHVDFAYEVARSLAACDGALLLVDATQGVQAQSMSVFHIARARGLTIIPVLNKIDMVAAQPERVAMQMQATFGISPQDVIHISAKMGTGVEDVLNAIIERIPPPKGRQEQPLRAFLFDSMYDRYRGVVSLVNIQDGVLRKGDKIQSCYTRKKYDITELGFMYPEEVPTTSLRAGQVGYIACNMKESSEAHIGDTMHRQGESVEPMGGLKPSQAMVYAGVFPIDSNDFLKLEESIKRLTLTDRSVTVARESSAALGQGCRLGFLGTLHMDVFRQRMEDEYDASVIITAPTVPYKVVYKEKGKLREAIISNPTDFPDVADQSARVQQIEEPVVSATIIVPEDFLGEILSLVYSHRATDVVHKYLDAGGADGSPRAILTCILPLGEIVTDFFSNLKSRSSGHASFDYEDAGYQKSDLGKMTFLLNGKPVDALALIVHKSAQVKVAQTWVQKLKKVIPRQMYQLPIQAAVGNKILARENLSAYRADVTAGLYGGHYERKLKHLENQKESKKKMKRVGTVDLPQEAFFDMLKS